MPGKSSQFPRFYFMGKPFYLNRALLWLDAYRFLPHRLHIALWNWCFRMDVDWRIVGKNRASLWLDAYRFLPWRLRVAMWNWCFGMDLDWRAAKERTRRERKGER
ncbi:hypothetical protein SAMN05421819_3572 [Bryocella elongata]|uniref:Uncharacterized protein n=1 Tax=Bryocella elongata TaxID=863522 RepID=A0A1H6B6M3_9BACT|nr:hypothetical protein SAMN05421819_3572 [Bryocella elongata]